MSNESITYINLIEREDSVSKQMILFTDPKESLSKIIKKENQYERNNTQY